MDLFLLYARCSDNVYIPVPSPVALSNAISPGTSLLFYFADANAFLCKRGFKTLSDLFIVQYLGPSNQPLRRQHVDPKLGNVRLHDRLPSPLRDRQLHSPHAARMSPIAGVVLFQGGVLFVSVYVYRGGLVGGDFTGIEYPHYHRRGCKRGKRDVYWGDWYVRRRRVECFSMAQGVLAFCDGVGGVVISFCAPRESDLRPLFAGDIFLLRGPYHH